MPVLDTSFLVDVLRGHGDATRLADILDQGAAPVGISPISTYELYRGVGHAARRDHEEHRVQDLLAEMTTFPLEPEAAKMAGLILAGMERAGQPISLLDLLIGCTAVHHGQAVVTRNVRDFDRIPGLDLLHY